MILIRVHVRELSSVRFKAECLAHDVHGEGSTHAEAIAMCKAALFRKMAHEYEAGRKSADIERVFVYGDGEEWWCEGTVDSGTKAVRVMFPVMFPLAKHVERGRAIAEASKTIGKIGPVTEFDVFQL